MIEFENKAMKYLFLLIFFLSPLLSPAKKKPNSRSITRSYKLVKLKDGDKMMVITYPKTEVNIDIKNHKIKCYILCNSVSGEFFVQKNKIKPMHLISTEVVCPVQMDGLHEKFLKNMSCVNKYKSDKGFTYLLNGKEVLIVLKRK